jgi:hypothetical protein
MRIGSPLRIGAQAALALLPAALCAVGVFGRMALGGITVPWALTLLGVWCIVISWLLWCRREAYGGIGLMPAAAFSAAVLAVLYASDSAHHQWVFTPSPKALALSIGALLVWYAGTARPPVVPALGATGVLHALSFSQVATDDLIRYWGIADGLVAGAGYSVTAGVPGSVEFYLVDLPSFPIALVGSFALFGHRYAAAHVPLVVANAALPFLYYALARAVGASRLRALALTLLLISFPQYQVYTLGGSQPDPLWAALVAGMLLAAVRRAWIALGLCAAAVVLTRPEGVVYAALVFAGLFWTYRRRPKGVLVAAALAAPPVLAFAVALYAQFGIVWAATGWTNVASLRYVLPNLEIVVRSNLPHYAEVLALPARAVSGAALAGLVIAVALWGTMRLWRTWPALSGVPFAIAANLLIILTSPTDLGADRLGPATFFRHASVCMPALVPLLALGAPRLSFPRVAIAAPAIAVLAWQLHVLGDTAARTGRGELTALTADPYVLLSDMWRMDDRLPHLPFRAGPGRGTEIDPAFEYLAFRNALFAQARPHDLHVNDAGRAYTLAALVFGAAGIAGLTVAAARRRPARG